jgi:GTPase SAR1 family protein
MQALKIILVGDSGVGKSQLSRCMMNKEFQVSCE